jgi:hypothetical protein
MKYYAVTKKRGRSIVCDPKRCPRFLKSRAKTSRQKIRDAVLINTYKFLKI